MNSKLIMPFSAIAIAAVVLLFASVSFVGIQQAFAQWMGHPWNWWYGHGHWGGGYHGRPGWWWHPWHDIPIGGGTEIIGEAGYPVGAPSLVRTDHTTIGNSEEDSTYLFIFYTNVK